MVFHIANYMRETNVWMIRKMRWMFWGVVASVPIYRNTYWDYLGRRSAWREYYFGGSVEQRIATAESWEGNWGYHPRYEAKLPFSIKTAKYEAQTPLEAVRDIPRIHKKASMIYGQEGISKPKEVRSMMNVFLEHNRAPGVFDYNYPQNFYSTHPEIERESYVTVGGKAQRRVHVDQDQEYTDLN